jgi:hypothetical protein
MDEGAINGAAIEAIKDLEIDCEIKEVRQPAGGDEWCIQFSGKYGQFCDEFKNQFGEESSHQVIREKIKSHLIKQVSKIRSGTGRKRQPAVSETDGSRETEDGILAAPLKMVGEVFDRLAGITGIVISQATTAAETAREAVADAASNLPPVTIEVRGKTRAVQKRVAAPPRKKATKASKARTTKTKKATKRAAPPVRKPAKKARPVRGKSAGKTSSSPRKAKAAKKTARRRK